MSLEFYSVSNKRLSVWPLHYAAWRRRDSRRSDAILLHVGIPSERKQLVSLSSTGHGTALCTAVVRRGALKGCWKSERHSLTYVGRDSSGWTVRGSNPGGGEIFRIGRGAEFRNEWSSHSSVATFRLPFICAKPG